MHLTDNRSNPQREETSDGNGHQNNDHCISQCNPENLILEQGLIVSKSDKDVIPSHGGIKKAGEHAHEHGVYHEHDKEQQEGEQEEIG